jgi:hypothetical protein
MKSRQFLKTVVGYLWRIPVCALAYVAGIVIGSIILSALGTDLPPAAKDAADTRACIIILSALGINSPLTPELANETTSVFYLLIGSIALAIGLAPIARRIQGAYWTRCLILAAFIFVSLGVNNAIEQSLFFSAQGSLLMIPIYFWPCVLLAGATTFLFEPLHKRDPLPAIVSRFFVGRTLGQWIWRFLASIVAFPLVYLVFGMIVSPIVVKYYNQGPLGLVLPDTGVMISIQFLRSFLFLLSSIPVLVMWSGNRLQLVVLLGFAFFVFAGIAVAYWLPLLLRVTHSVEVLADSLVYAWFLVTLLVQKKKL